MRLAHPGKTLLYHYLVPLKISQNALARLIKVPPRRINEIVLGKRSISVDTAIRLGIYFGKHANATYWITMQAKYDITKIENKIHLELEGIKPLLATQAYDEILPEPEPNKKNRSKIKSRILR